jgi:hypothetical protein
MKNSMMILVAGMMISTLSFAGPVGGETVLPCLRGNKTDRYCSSSSLCKGAVTHSEKAQNAQKAAK